MSTVEHEADTAAPGPGLPPPTGTPARRPVARGQDRIVAGVADGLSDALGVPPVWTRLAFVVLSLFGGLGVVVYAAGWLLMPPAPGAPAPRGLRRVAGIVLVPLWLLIIAAPNGNGPWRFVDGPWALAALLVGVALALWKPGSTQARARIAPAPVPSPTSAVPVPETTAVRTPRPYSPLGRVTFGAALVVAAVGTAISEGSGAGVKIAFGLAGLLCGLGLLVGTLFGRARWLIVPALLFAGVSVAGAATDGLGVHQAWAETDTSWYPGDEANPTPPTLIDQGAGNVYLQLERLTTPVDGVIRVGRGHVTISADENVRLEVHAQVGIGSIFLPNGTERGYRREASSTTGPADGTPVRYDVAVGFGEIHIVRYTAPPPKPATAEPASTLPPGAIGVDGAGGFVYPDGTVQAADGTILLPDGTVIAPDGSVRLGGVGVVLAPRGPTTTTTVPAQTTVPPETTAPTVTTVPAVPTVPPVTEAAP
jgi:phage shock protein PspC (stress-responsive transcriptional regulator)